MLLLYPLMGLAALLTAGAVAGEVNKGSEPVRLRTLNRSDAASPMKWEAVELLSDAALHEVGLLMDLALAPYATQCRTGLYTVFLLTDQTDGVGRAIAVLARKSGDGWVVDQAFGRSNTQAPADLVALAQAITAKMGGAAADVSAYAIPDDDALPGDAAPALPAPTPRRALPAPVENPMGLTPDDAADHEEVPAGTDEASDEANDAGLDETYPESGVPEGSDEFWDNPDLEDEGASLDQ